MLLEKRKEKALNLIEGLNLEAELKKSIEEVIEEVFIENAPCIVDNTFKEINYGNAKFIQVCPSPAAVKEYNTEVQRRQSDPIYIEIIKCVQESESEDLTAERAEEINENIIKLSDELANKYTCDLFKRKIIVASLIGNPLLKGSLVVEGKEYAPNDIIDDISAYPEQLQTELLANALDLFAIRKEEEKN